MQEPIKPGKEPRVGHPCAR